jgi:uncharacterized membrane protein YsdA (DUF1294 family)/cold shock CspA family protein
MRFKGHLKSWNDERGFGFIEPAEGGQEIFVHIRAFASRSVRPKIGQLLNFEVEINSDGKKRATKVLLAGSARPRRSKAPRAWGTASLLAIPAFLFLYLAVAVVWRVPYWVAVAYLASSVVCFVYYALDKSAAAAGRWRVPESTLIVLGLACGWPGAIVAQQVLRHKSAKEEFRSAFWASVALNIIAFIILCSPMVSFLGPIIRLTNGSSDRGVASSVSGETHPAPSVSRYHARLPSAAIQRNGSFGT